MGSILLLQFCARERYGPGGQQDIHERVHRPQGNKQRRATRKGGEGGEEEDRAFEQEGTSGNRISHHHTYRRRTTLRSVDQFSICKHLCQLKTNSVCMVAMLSVPQYSRYRKQGVSCTYSPCLLFRGCLL